MHIMLSTYAYIPLASDLIVVGGGGWVVEGLMCGIKVLQHDFVLKMKGGLMCEGEHICGTLWY